MKIHFYPEELLFERAFILLSSSFTLVNWQTGIKVQQIHRHLVNLQPLQAAIIHEVVSWRQPRRQSWRSSYKQSQYIKLMWTIFMIKIKYYKCFSLNCLNKANLHDLQWIELTFVDKKRATGWAAYKHTLVTLSINNFSLVEVKIQVEHKPTNLLIGQFENFNEF